MKARNYRKKPVVIEAVQWLGHNIDEIENFVGDKCYLRESVLYIKTLEGHHASLVTDYIIKGIAGEYYPCKENIFRQTYEEA